MECICRDLGRHIRFQQGRYSPGYYRPAITRCVKSTLLMRSDVFVQKANACLAPFGISVSMDNLYEESKIERECGQ